MWSWILRLAERLLRCFPDLIHGPEGGSGVVTGIVSQSRLGSQLTEDPGERRRRSWRSRNGNVFQSVAVTLPPWCRATVEKSQHPS